MQRQLTTSDHKVTGLALKSAIDGHHKTANTAKQQSKAKQSKAAAFGINTAHKT